MDDSFQCMTKSTTIKKIKKKKNCFLLKYNKPQVNYESSVWNWENNSDSNNFAIIIYFSKNCYKSKEVKAFLHETFSYSSLEYYCLQ